MKALVLMGNLGTGKSTVANLISKSIDVTVFDIDRYRTVFKGNEFDAKLAMLEEVKNCNSNLIYECTTANAIHNQVIKILEGKQCEIFRILLSSNMDVAKNRWIPKKYNPTGRDWEESWSYIEDKLKKQPVDIGINTSVAPPEVFLPMIMEFFDT